MVNEATFSRVLGEVSDGVAVLARDGTVAYVNRAYCEMTGYDPSDIGKLPFGIKTGPSTSAETVARINAAVAGASNYAGEILSYRKSGDAFWIALSIMPDTDGDCIVRQMICIMRDITERHTVEGSTAQLERNYQLIFENVQAAIVIYGADGQVRIANRRATEALQVSQESLVGRGIGERRYRLFRVDGSEIAPDEFPVRQVLESHEPVRDVLLRYVSNEDARQFWFVCSAFPLFDECGAISQVLLSFSDVTRLMDSESEARVLRERFELAARATQDAIFDWDIKTGQLWANEAYEAVYGYAPPAYMRLEALEETSAVVADHDKVRDTVLDAIHSGKQRYSLDYEFKRPDGTHGHVAVRAFIVRDVSGEAQRIIGTATNIAQLTRATAALEQSEMRFRHIADSASDVLWDHDFDTGLTWSSPDWPAKLGVTFDTADVQNFKWVELVDQSDRVRLLKSFHDVLRSDASSWEIEFRSLSKEGQVFDFAVKAAILRHPNGRASRMLGNMRNVTKEKRNQEGYTRSRALEAVGQLTGGIAHDFNNLLMIILGNAEALEISELKKEDAEAVASISSAAESAAKLTRRLLTFARQAQLTTSRVDVAALVSETMTLLKAGLPESVGLSQVIAPDLWSVDADPNSLEQAIVNLAMNASDAMPRGGKIVLTCSNLEVGHDMIPANGDLRPGRYVTISISDTGQGMPPEVLARAFEPFFTTKEVGKGTGLGLSTVYGFAKQSNGGVIIYSEPGHGTTVNLYLPASEGEAGTIDKVETQPGPDLTARSKRILVVEDQPQVRTHVEKTLKRLGYQVETAEDAKSALNLIQNGNFFDLLFTDIIMPGGINGQELGETVARLSPNTKILYSSGYPAAAFEKLGLKEQSTINFLSKPYKSSQLSDKLSEIFSTSTYDK